MSDEPLTYPNPDEIVDVASANWTLRNLKRTRKALEKIADDRDQMIREANEWAADRMSGLIQSAKADEVRLAAFLADEIARNPKGPKSIQLPAGTVSSTAGSMVYTGPDGAPINPEIAAQWGVLADEKPPPPRIPDLNAVGKLVTSGRLRVADDDGTPGTYRLVDPTTGEFVDGIVVTRKPRTFKIEGA